MIEESGPCPDGNVVKGVLDVDDEATGFADRIADSVHIGHDFPGGADLGDLTRRHETILEIDYNMRSLPGNYAIKYA
jgi:hypothetical protein